ncbi:hypothetical protein Hanom_Chr01g00005691 [Helianthus anomalus]
MLVMAMNSELSDSWVFFNAAWAILFLIQKMHNLVKKAEGNSIVDPWIIIGFKNQVVHRDDIV